LAVDHALKLLLAPARLGDEAEPGLADEADALRNSRQERRKRRFPRARHDEHRAVVLRPQLLGELPAVGERELPGRQVADDALAHAGHVVEVRRRPGGREHVDGTVGKAGIEQLDRRMPAHVVADPEVRNDEDWPRVRVLQRRLGRRRGWWVRRVHVSRYSALPGRGVSPADRAFSSPPLSGQLGGRPLRLRPPPAWGKGLPQKRPRPPRGDMFDFAKRLTGLEKTRVLCVGDLMLDAFVYGEVERISPEAPAPVLAVKREELVIGGAGNVARNIAG